MDERRWLFDGVERPDADALDVYRSNGGYDGAWRAFDEIDPVALIDEVAAAGLRGQGGAWRSVAERWQEALRWRLAAAGGSAAVVCVDVTEPEAGRFRDRKLAERLPHRLIEGALIAALAVEAEVVYLCVRADWVRARTVLAHALAEARAAGWIERPLGRSGHRVRFHLHPVPGPLPNRGGDSLLPGLIEFGRPQPIADDDSPGLPSLFGHPVLVHTAATLGYLPGIFTHGANAFRQLGTPSFPGTVSLSVSGHVCRPGLFEVEIGSGSFGDVIDRCAGGVVDKGPPTAVFPAGAPSLRGDDLWAAPVDPGAWAEPGGGNRPGVFGSGTLIIADDRAQAIVMAAAWMQDAAANGCGQCPGCREGTAWLAHGLARLRSGGENVVDLDDLRRRLHDLGQAETRGLVICGHARVAADVTIGLLALDSDVLATQARAGATEVSGIDHLRTADSIHLRF